MADVVIFGTRDTAELAHHYLREDSPHRVVGFSVHAAYRDRDIFLDLPVVDFETLPQHFPPDQVAGFAPMTARGMNRPRAAVHARMREMGYACISYVSSRATVLSQDIGENCFILEHNVIQHGVHIGDDVVLWSGNHIGHHSRIEAHNFLTSHVVVSGHCRLAPHGFFGVNATLCDGIAVAEGCFLAMASALTRGVDAPWGVYRGNPARRLRVDSRRFYA